MITVASDRNIAIDIELLTENPISQSIKNAVNWPARAKFNWSESFDDGQFSLNIILHNAYQQ